MSLSGSLSLLPLEVPKTILCQRTDLIIVGLWTTQISVASGGGDYIAPNVLGVSLRNKQNYNSKLLNSDSPLN